MATINNAQLTKELIEGAKIQLSYDDVPGRLATAVVPTMEVNPKLMRVANVVDGTGESTSGTITLYTSPEDRDFYLTNAIISFSKDATCDVSTGSLQLKGYMNGVNIRLAELALLTLTAERDSLSVVFPTPLKLDRGSSISIAATFAAGVMRKSGNIIGYTVED